MQGKKDYQEELFVSFQLSDRVPENNFYRRLKDHLHLDYLYKLTQPFYGSCGQQSIDSTVFFKLCLVGYLENITSDRGLMNHCSMRLDILYFLGYNISEPLPWHSTLSRTRDLLPEDLFQQVFEDILKKCVEAGLVSGHTQVVDSAPIKANASMDSLELKVPAEDLEEHLRKVRYQSTADREAPRRQAQQNKATAQQKTISGDKREMQEIKSRNQRWKKDQDERPGAKANHSKYTSNKTHYSPTDPDARISVKPGKARKLNYLSQLGVDTAYHVITHIGADFADKKDNQCLPQIIRELKPRMERMGVLFTTLMADAGYSSGENYALLEKESLQAYIPPHGTYKGGPEGFKYHKEGDYWLCRNGKKVTFRQVKVERKNQIKKKQYFTRRSDCKGCPFKTECIGKAYEKRIEITYYNEEYQRTLARLKTPLGRRSKAIRQSTVEPVFGILTQHMSLRKLNTKGIRNANKQMLLAGIAYNLKKLLKYSKPLPKSVANSAKATSLLKNLLQGYVLSLFPPLKLT